MPVPRAVHSSATQLLAVVAAAWCRVYIGNVCLPLATSEDGEERANDILEWCLPQDTSDLGLEPGI